MDSSDSEDFNNDLLGPEDYFSDESNIEEKKDEDNNEEKNSSDKTSKNDAPKKVKRKVVNKKPSKRVKLNYNRLAGPNGLELLKKTFKNFKFKGNNHEKEDLTKVMRILQHWMCNCLFPSGDFDGNIERLEMLGNKKIVQTYMKKIRMGIDDWGENKSDEKDIISLDNNFDSLKTDYDKVNFDEYNILPLSEENDWSMPSCSNMLPPDNSNNDKNAQIQEENNTLTPQKSQVDQIEITLTPEQLERIARNKQLAQERKLKRLADRNSSQLSAVIN